MGNKKNAKTKKKPLTVKYVQSCVKITLDGKLRLDLSLKDIRDVPKSILKLSDLDEMDLSRNLIKTIPDFMEYFIKITVLDLHSNYLEELPKTIGSLQGLEVLNLSNNRLTILPDELGLLNNLKNLNLGLNLLQTLPPSIGSLKQLQFLGLADNKFAIIPNCLARLPQVERVNLDGNPILTQLLHKKTAVKSTDGFYLVRESDLCEECLNKYKTARKMIQNAEEHEV